MKKAYLAPKSETLMAILGDVCGDIQGDPSLFGGSPVPYQSPRINSAPAAGHGL